MVAPAAKARAAPEKAAAPKPARGEARKAKAAPVHWSITALRIVAFAVFLGAIPVILGLDIGRRLFWTVTIATIPLFFTAAGFYLWRRICPLAAFGQTGKLVGRPGKRKAGEWLARNYPLVQMGVLVTALAIRLIATNGTAWALASFVALIVVAAITVSFLYTGKTWCNYFCPVGIVEKIYNEPAHLRPQDNSQCASCTACKKNCPDIDVEQGYWKEADSKARRGVYFAWPGIVLGFYTWFWLCAGDWDYYFSGAWTRESEQVHLASAPGLHFAEWIPRAVSAPLTLLAFGAVSFLLFHLGEKLFLARGADAARTRHRALVLAGFTGFVIFYCFAGQPTLRKLPEVVRTSIGIGVIVVATAMFLKRWGRKEEAYVQEKFAKGVLKRWEWGDAPPSDSLADIYLIHTERTKQREARLKAYKETVREMIADGVVSRNELQLLDKLRGQLGVNDKDHEKVLSELSAEEKRLFDPAYHGSVEKRLQEEQYRRDLERLVLIGGTTDPAALEQLRVAHGVPPAEHEAALKALRAESGPILAEAREEAASALELRRAVRRARAAERPKYAGSSAEHHSMSIAFFAYLAAWRAAQHVERAQALVKLAPTEGEPVTTIAAMQADPGVDKVPPADPDADAKALLAVAKNESAYVRAAAAYILSRFDDADARAAVTDAMTDASPLVRETAVRALGARGRLTREMVARAMDDADPRVVRAVMRAVVPAAAAMSQPARERSAANPQGPRDPGAEHGEATRSAPRGVSEPSSIDPAKLAQTTQGVGNPDPAQFATLDPTAAIDTLSTFEKMMLLRQVPLFTALEPDDLEELSQIAEERRFGRNQDLCKEGEESDDVFLVVSGLVRAWIAGAGGEPRVLGESGDGSCIGEMAALDRAPRTATVSAVAPTRVLVLPGREFQQLLADRPAISTGVIRVLTQRLRGMIAAERKS